MHRKLIPREVEPTTVDSPAAIHPGCDHLDARINRLKLYPNGPPGARYPVFARASAGGLVSVAAAAEALHLSSREAAVRLARLERAGWLARVRRGLYVVRPLESARTAIPTVEDPWVLARELFSRCYIAGWTAAEHWGLTEQIFRRDDGCDGCSAS